jgi:hypothetical protein
VPWMLYLWWFSHRPLRFCLSLSLSAPLSPFVLDFIVFFPFGSFLCPVVLVRIFTFPFISSFGL